MSAVAPPALSIAAELPYNESGITGYFDTTVSIGTAIRTQGRDKAIIAIANGGYAPSFNEDDGNLNYNKGDFVSANVKVSHELQLDVGKLSFFSRAFYFYDHAAAANDTRRTSLSGKAQQYAGHDIQLLDAYVSTDIDVGEFPLSIRIGNQVLNWGENVFIRNGLNSINPIDVSKVHIAGAEVRDVVTPIPAVNLKVGLTDNLSLEGFYQFRWLHTRLEPAGTFFSTTDAASPGGDIIHFGFGDPLRGNDEDGQADPYCYTGLCSRLPRVSDRNARHQGQFGLAVRYFAPALNDAELGFYYARIHSRLPLVSARAGNPQALTDPKGFAGSVQYFREFPEDIDIMGASFNTEIGTSGFAIQGEVSYRRNQPLQIDAVEVIFSTLSPLRFVQVPQTLLPLLQNPGCLRTEFSCLQTGARTRTVTRGGRVVQPEPNRSSRSRGRGHRLSPQGRAAGAGRHLEGIGSHVRRRSIPVPGRDRFHLCPGHGGQIGPSLRWTGHVDERQPDLYAHHSAGDPERRLCRSVLLGLPDSRADDLQQRHRLREPVAADLVRARRERHDAVTDQQFRRGPQNHHAVD